MNNIVLYKYTFARVWPLLTANFEKELLPAKSSRQDDYTTTPLIYFPILDYQIENVIFCSFQLGRLRCFCIDAAHFYWYRDLSCLERCK